MKKLSSKYFLLIAILVSLQIPFKSSAYSVLTHEAIIDVSWDKSIRPILKSRYPGSTEAEFKKARAYSYGGAILADMGYYPFGASFFTELVHYVRSGDFVIALMEEAQDINEYAFALGALAHYTSDNYGHPLGINLAVPLAYPKVREKYGNTVTYEQDRTSHLRMEFGFDVLETARGNYESLAYHDFIGFEVARPVLERAFIKTYGLDINKVFVNLSLALGTFRWAVKNLIPEATKYAWIIKKSEIVKLNPQAQAKKFRYKMSKANYYKEFGKERTKPPIGSRALSMLLRIVPKIGPLKGLRFNNPGLEAEKLFTQSFDTVVACYASFLNKSISGKLRLENKDFDTGKLTVPGEYHLADENYGQLLLKLKKEKFDHMNPSLKKDIISFYSQADSTILVKENQKGWKEIVESLEMLKSVSCN